MTITLQHAPLKVQEYYLPVLRKAYEEKKLTGDYLSIFEDRINCRNNKFQYYGTQVIYYKNKPVLYPVVNIDSVNIWRKRRGFISTIESYLKYSFKQEFDKNAYIKALPKLIEFRKIKDTFWQDNHFFKIEMPSN